MNKEDRGIALSGEDGRAVRSSSGPEGEAMRLAVLESISGPGIINVMNIESHSSGRSLREEERCTAANEKQFTF